MALALSRPDALVLTWPTNFTGFVLQANTNLATANWSAVTNVVGTDNRVTISPLSGSAFFGLVHH